MKRDYAVTYSKAIAIMMMVLGHACFQTYMETLVNMFDIPTFFFLSGYCFKKKYILDNKSFFMNKLRGIYLPYVKWTVVFTLIHNLLYALGVYNSYYGFNGKCSSLYSFNDVVLNIFNAMFYLNGGERLLGGYWFLPCLFVGSLVFFVVVIFSSFFNKRFLLLYCGVGLLFLSFLCNKFQISFWVFNYRAFEASLFILFGYCYKLFNINLHSSIYFCVCSFIIVVVGSFYWPGAAVKVIPNNQIPFIITSMCGCISLLGLCKKIESYNIYSLHSVLCFVGDNTLTILTWHFSIFVVVSYFVTLIYNLSHLRIGEFPVILEFSHQGWWIVYFVFGVLGSLLLAYFNKYIKSIWLKL